MSNKRALRKPLDASSAFSWDLVRTFLALERYGEYSLAAEMEGLDDSTLRRRIQTLERLVGRTLFVRSEKGWKVSADVRPLIEAAYRMEQAAQQFSRSSIEEEGTIRISMMDAFAYEFSGVLAEFNKKYPRLTLNLTTETHFVDLEQERVDIAIRLARPVQGAGSLHITKIADIPVNAYASKAYLERQAQSAAQNSIPHRLLGMNIAFSHEDHSFVYGGLDCKKFGFEGEVTAWFDSFSLLARMCELGFGVAIMPTLMVRQCSGLQKVEPERANVVTELWMVSRFNLRAAWQQDLAAMLRQDLVDRQES